jgi:peptide/nickel transport system ATP-binding protein
MSSPLIKVSNLTVSTSDDNRTLVNSVSFEIAPGEAVGVVGESGSGKTLTALSLLGLLPRGVQATEGSISYDGKDLLHTDGETLRSIRGNKIAMI